VQNTEVPFSATAAPVREPARLGIGLIGVGVVARRQSMFWNEAQPSHMPISANEPDELVMFIAPANVTVWVVVE
jgi:hypothetical protein